MEENSQRDEVFSRAIRVLLLETPSWGGILAGKV